MRHGNLGDPMQLSPKKGVWPTSSTNQGGQKGGGESDRPIVPMKRSNVCGGKAGDGNIDLIEET